MDGLGLLGGGAAQADDGVGHQRQRDHGEDEYQEHGVVLLRGRHGCRSRAARGVLIRAAVGDRIRRRGCRGWGGGRRIWARRDGMVKEREARWSEDRFWVSSSSGRCTPTRNGTANGLRAEERPFPFVVTGEEGCRSDASRPVTLIDIRPVSFF
jgi:hypothetical protein